MHSWIRDRNSAISHIKIVQMTRTQRTPPVILAEFIAAIGQASNAAWQLVHSRQLPAFLPIRDRLELIKQKCLKIAINAQNEVNRAN